MILSTLKTFLFNRNTLLICFLTVLSAVVLNNRADLFFNFIKKLYVPNSTKQLQKLYTEEQLSQYNGVSSDFLFLSVLGSVYDVTKGRKHYEPGASYNYFVGKDGSRSFITGDFSDTSQDKDHVLELSCDEINALMGWRDTFRKRYSYKGKLSGRYYDGNGAPTEYNKSVKAKLNICKKEKEATNEHNTIFPPCNMEWSADLGSRVWCTKNSGGIVRDWAGVPRQLYTPGQPAPRCACVNLSNMDTSALIKEYDNCAPESVSCKVESSK